MRSTWRNIRRQVFYPRLDPLPELLGDAALISIDPARITRYAETPAEIHKAANKYVRAYYKRTNRFILPGRWDRNCGRFKDLERYQFIEELKRYDFDYTKCTRFRALINQVKRGVVVSYKNKRLEFRSEEDVHNYLRGHVEVCKSMREFGYLQEKTKDHVCVMIGRDGEIIKEVRGRHRLAIAQVFEVKRILALIRHVHPLWVKKQAARFGRLPIDELLALSFRQLETEETVSNAASPDLERSPVL